MYASYVRTFWKSVRGLQPEGGMLWRPGCDDIHEEGVGDGGGAAEEDDDEEEAEDKA